VKIDVQLTPESRRKLRSLEKEFPRTMYRAFGAAAKRARSRFVKVMRSAGGVYNVPQMAPHHEISGILRPGQKMGGVLAEAERIVMYKVDPDTQYIGWPDSLAKWAEKFQAAETKPFAPGTRKWMHRKGVRVVPATYQRPERDVVASFAANLANDWPGMVLEMFDKYYRSRMAKYGSVK
jgi:hypothetical protein